jgi:oligoribonuclease NrnB/cAMP/cGMP phosphodiesterase (DHH superfamily)
LFYEYLLSTGFKANASTDSFVEQVRRWDTWEWKNIYNDLEPKKLNDLLKLVGPSAFSGKMVWRLGNDQTAIAPEDEEIIRLEQERNQDFIEKKSREIILRRYDGYMLGVVFADRCLSELGNYICEQNPGIDIAVMIDPSRSISFRASKENIDVSVIAKQLGGGGHKYASGAPVPKALAGIIIDTIFED